jgi:hypothetical protein
MASDWQNPVVPEDVDNSGFVAIADALLLVSNLRNNGIPHPLTNPFPGPAQAHYLDPNGDGQAAISDLLQIVTDLRNGIGLPALQFDAALANDTAPNGATNDDRLTSDAAVAGEILSGLTDGSRIVAKLDSRPLFRVMPDLDGAFRFHSGLANDGSDDGQHTLRLTLQNFGGPISTFDLTFTFDTVGPQRPAIQLTPASDSGSSNTDGVTNRTAPIFQVTAQPGDFVRLLIDDAEVASTIADGPVHLTTIPLADGRKQVIAVLEDLAGNGVASAETEITIDTTAPASPAAPVLAPESDSGRSNQDGVTNVSTPTFRISAELDTMVRLLVDDVESGFGAGKTEFEVSVGPLSDGQWQVRATAEDLAGNVSPPSAALQITIDTAAPSIPATPRLTPASDSGRRDDDGITSIVAPTIRVTAGSNEWVRLFVDGAESASKLGSGDMDFFVGPFAEGPLHVHATAEDLAGNVSQATVPAQFTIDATAPLAPLPPELTPESDSGRSNTDGVTNIATPVFRVSGQGSELVRLLVDGVEVASGEANGVLNLQASSLVDGRRHVQATAEDVAGNISPPSGITAISIDTTIPTPTLLLSSGSLSPSGDPQTTSSARVKVIGQSEPNATVTLMETGATSLVTGAGAFQFPNVPLSVGENPLSLQAVDAAGNSSQVTQVITRLTDAAEQDEVLIWSQAALDAIRNDASTPPYASRTLAMVSVAMYDVVNAIEGTAAFLVAKTASPDTSLNAAVASAAFQVLSHLYPAQQNTFEIQLQRSLESVADGAGEASGVSLGQSIAEAVILLRSNDGWNDFVDYVAGSQPGAWRPTAPMHMVALLPQWADVTPFAMSTPNQFRPDGPPDLNSAEYAADFNEVKDLGRAAGATRTTNQTEIARFWADGPGTYTPAGHWNQIALEFIAAQRFSPSASAHLLAQLNVALADAAVVAWDAKYAYQTWRPITAIQEAADDGNDSTNADPAWRSLLTTPPFPEYVSGHSTFSGAAAKILTAAFGDHVSFTTSSLGLPGVERTFNNFDAAADEAGRSRVYGGIHYEFSNRDGQAAGRALAQHVLNTFDVATDIKAPTTLIASHPSGVVIAENITLTGQALDNLTGVKRLEVQLDEGSFTDAALGADGAFALPTSFALEGSDDGEHRYRLRTTDFAGNQSLDEFILILDTRAPAITLEEPAADAALAAGSRISGVASGTGPAVTALSYAFNGGTAVPISFDGGSGSFSEQLDLSRLAPGSHTLKVRARDAAGNTAEQTINVTLSAAIPLQIIAHAPVRGARDVGSTFHPKITFARPIDPATLNAGNFFATDTTGAKLPANIVVSNDGSFAWLFFHNPMPGSSTISVTVDGSAIQAADGALLDAAGDGVPGSKLQFQFSTVSLTGIPGTTISGVVADPGPDLMPMTIDDVRAGADGVLNTLDDVYLNPLAGVKVWVLGLEAQAVYTDAQGRFQLDNTPTGNVKLAIDGRTAANAPAGFYFPEMVMDMTIEPARANTVMGSMGQPETMRALEDVPGVYLPRLRTSILQNVDAATPTTIGVSAEAAPNLTPQQRAMLSIEVPPGSLIGPDGQPLTSGQIGISTVPPEMVREMLPAGLLQHTFDITVQAPGISNFSTPAKMTFPNVFNAAPGTKLNFLSFDHTTGRLIIEGTATVSADGLTVTTDPDTGITHPGWHGLTPPGSRGEGDEPREKDPPECSASASEFANEEILTAIPLALDGSQASPATQVACNGFQIELRFLDSNLSSDIQSTIAAAARKWEEVIVGDVPNVYSLILGRIIDDVVIDVVGSFDEEFAHTVVIGNRSGSLLPFRSRMTFNIFEAHKLESAFGLFPVALHEIGHALGFGSIWEDRGLLIGTDPFEPHFDPRFIGMHASIEYSALLGSPAFVPVEAELHSRHWSEKDFGLEVMTPDAEPSSPQPLSRVTVASMADLGYTVNLDAAQQDFRLPIMGNNLRNLTTEPTVNRSNLFTERVRLDVEPALAEVIAFHGDFGTESSPVAIGYQHVTSATEYALAIGYGWMSPIGNVRAVDRGESATTNALVQDFNLTRQGTFLIDLPNGVYDVGVMVGDANSARQEQEINLEGVRRGNISTLAGEFIRNIYRVNVIDGQLTLDLGSNSEVAVNSIEVQLVSLFEESDLPTSASSETVGRFHYAIENQANGFLIRGQTTLSSPGPLNPEGVFLSPNTSYRQYVYQVDTGAIGMSDFTTPSSGNNFRLPNIEVRREFTRDIDSDGLSDLAEFIIGTIENRPDSDGDGVGDLAEIEQGLDPLSGRAFPTGIVASVPLQGQAKELVIEGSTLKDQQQTAFVATGSYGLALVDVSQFQKPIVLSQLDLAGDSTDVSVDTRLNIAAVASTAGLHLVNVADPQRPQLIQTLSSAGGQVEAFEGIAYVADGATLRSYDLLTGEALQSLSVSASITGLARGGTMLFTMDAGRVLSAIEITPQGMTLRDTLTMPFGRGKLFVGGGVAYVAAEGDAPGGFATANVSDPDNLTLISNVDAVNLAGRTIAVNGSGLAVTVGSPVGLGNLLQVVNVNDPADTNGFLTQFNLPSEPFSVAIGGGLGFVAGGSSGLHVVNYLPFDSGGTPPNATIETVAADLDPSTPGLQVLGASLVGVTASVTDDVQVRRVEFLRNGQVVATDVSFPWDAFIPLPPFSPEASTISLQVRATDTGGNTTLSAPLILELTPDPTPPTITQISPADGAMVSGIRTVRINFSEPMDESTITPENIRLINTSDLDNPLTPVDVQLRNQGQSVQLAYSSLPSGNYRVNIEAPAVTDRSGNPLGDEAVTSFFFISDFAATIRWVNPAGGFWDDPANWEGGRLPGPHDDVFIDVPGDVAITHQTGNTTIRSLISNNPFTITGGTFTVTQTVQVNNIFTINGGTLKDATVLAGSGGQGIEFTSNSNNRLTGVTVNGDLFLTASGARARIEGGTTFTTAHLIGGSSAIGFAPGSVLSGTVLFEGSSTNGRNVTMNGAAGTLTIGPTGVIRTAADFTDQATIGQVGGAFGGNMTLVNQGTIRSQTSGAGINFNPVNGFRNEGTLEVQSGGFMRTVGASIMRGNLNTVTLSGSGSLVQLTGMNMVNNLGLSVGPGHTLQLNGTWSSTGPMHVDGGTLVLAGNFTTSGLNLPAFTSNGGTVNLTGVLDNAGSTLTLNAATGSWNLQGGTISGGAVNLTEGTLLEIAPTISPAFSRLTAVNVNGSLLLSGNNSRVNIESGTTFSTARLIGSGSTISFTPGSVLRGAILIEGANTGSRTVTMHGPTGTLTIESTGQIRTTADFAGTATIGGSTLVNQGAISSQTSGRTMTISPTTSFTNQGTLEAKDGGTLSLNGMWSNTGVLNLDGGTFTLGGNFTTAGLNLPAFTRNGGTVNVTGTLNNAGATLTLNAATGSWNLVGATISGGVLDLSADGTLLTITSAMNRLTGVTVNGDLFLSVNNSALSIEGGTIFSTAHFKSNDSSLRLAPDSALAGSLLFEGPNTGNRPVLMNGSSGTVTIGSTGELRTTSDFGGSASIGSNPFVGNMTLVNQGAIRSQTSGRTVTVNPSSLTNQGTLEAINGGNLSITNFEPNAGLLHTGTGSLISVTGDFTQSAAGAIQVELAGAAASEFGRVTVSGIATLDGTLNLQFANGFEPAVGATFPVLTYASRIGQFGAIIHNLPAGLTLLPNYGTTSLTLTVVNAVLAADEPRGDANGVIEGELSAIAAAVEFWRPLVKTSEQRQSLDAIHLRLADLRQALGANFGRQVTIGYNPAGSEWFVNRTPMEDDEFGLKMVRGAFMVRGATLADGRVDLPTAPSHEDVLDSLTAATLATGQRRLPTADAIDAVFAAGL